MDRVGQDYREKRNVQSTQIYTITQQHAQSILRGAGTRENGKKVRSEKESVEKIRPSSFATFRPGGASPSTPTYFQLVDISEIF